MTTAQNEQRRPADTKAASNVHHHTPRAFNAQAFFSRHRAEIMPPEVVAKLGELGDAWRKLSAEAEATTADKLLDAADAADAAYSADLENAKLRAAAIEARKRAVAAERGVDPQHTVARAARKAVNSDSGELVAGVIEKAAAILDREAAKAIAAVNDALSALGFEPDATIQRDVARTAELIRQRAERHRSGTCDAPPLEAIKNQLGIAA